MTMKKELQFFREFMWRQTSKADTLTFAETVLTAAVLLLLQQKMLIIGLF